MSSSQQANGAAVVIKMVIIGIIILVLLIPASMIGFLVDEREERKDEAVTEVLSKWAGEQTIFVPVLSVPYTEEETHNGNQIIVTKYLNILPDELNIDGDIQTKNLSRGIYDVLAYTTYLNIDGKFSSPGTADLSINKNSIQWNNAVLLLSISDLKGMQENVDLDWNGTQYRLNPEALKQDIAIPGTKLGVNIPIKSTNQNFEFSTKLSLRGGQRLAFFPAGDQTNVKLKSDWHAPSFDGPFLPDERSVTDSGFDASWKILQLNRAFPKVWHNNAPQYSEEENQSFGATLLIPVDEYQKTTRSIKYAAMIIALSFLVFFFVEILNKIRIHPIQYTLVGLSLVLFFSLLLSFSEHISFNLSYLVSTLATVLAVSLYSKSIFKDIKLTLLQSFILLGLYIFMFVIIQMQDYALLMGSIALFVVLSIVMYISRKINWYSINSKKES
jgi:inner membrane protein